MIKVLVLPRSSQKRHLELSHLEILPPRLATSHSSSCKQQSATMNNFGVIEIASTRTTNAPGWAYVPDVSVNSALAAQPSNRKRAARNQAIPNQLDVSARQDARIRKELEVLDRIAASDAGIPIPPKVGGGRVC